MATKKKATARKSGRKNASRTVAPRVPVAKSARGRQPDEPADPRAAQDYAKLVRAFLGEPGIDAAESRGFGSGALKVNGKIFATLASRQRFAVKLPAARVQALVAQGRGQPLGMEGRVMREWLVVGSGPESWLPLAREALAFVRSLQVRR